jgi:teichuronic acid biosynthesis glycosyltransferase TuaH
MKSEMDIIILSLARWDKEISSGAISMAKEFSKNNRVFYISHPYTLKEVAANLLKGKNKKKFFSILLGKHIVSREKDYGPHLYTITPPVCWPVNFLPNGKLYRFLSKKNDRKLSRLIQKLIKGYNINSYLFINSFDPFYLSQLPDSLTPALSVYRATDDISQENYITKHGPRLEKQLIRNYDLTFTTGMELFHQKKQISQEVYYLPNAADIQLFLSSLDDLPKPADWLFPFDQVIGYMGALENRLDYELLAKIARHHPDKALVLIGPLITDEHKSHGLHHCENVFFTGEKKIGELPQYLRWMDVALIPFKKTKLTKSIYPLKINEYLASGKAVVTTDFSEDIKTFKDIIYLAENHDEFLKMIDSALKENDSSLQKRRIERAKQNTWEARVGSFWEIVNKKLENK